ncbi:lantibiotic dehydratase [Streptomyces mirabilis]|nr:lantibiotic dehydratase [Streptomyces mirabilis]
MASRSGRLLYRSAETALVRASRHSTLELPAGPDLADDSPGHVERWCGWLEEVWRLPAVAEAIELATPSLAQQVQAVCSAADPDARQVRRTVISVIRYVLRMTTRATPFGLFAGVAPAVFGSDSAVGWGEEHRAIVRADATWISEVIARLEAMPDVLSRLPLMANTAAYVRGTRLIVPYPPRPRDAGRAAGAAEVRLRYTTPVRIAVETARAPMRYDSLVEKVAAEFPAVAAPKVAPLIDSLVEQGALISSLHAPSTAFDAFAHLMEQVEATGVGDVPQAGQLVGQLRDIRARMTEHNQAGSNTTPAGRGLRTALRKKMTAVSTTAVQPVAVDLRLDCSLTLPLSVAREAEAAASALARLTAFPFGTTAWKDYHNRFFERYGIGSLVPLLDVIDPDVGLGLPAGYLDAEPEPRELVTVREQRLLTLAQAAALDRRGEVVLDDHEVTELEVAGQAGMQVPPHFELRFQLESESTTALTRGDFRLSVVSASRGVGTTSGRFIGLLEEADQAQIAAVFERLPTSDPGTRAVQLSFAPLDPGDAHVTRAPQLLPAVISVAEHRPPGPDVIPLDDLAVGCDRRRLYLASISRGCRLDAAALNALELRAHTPPLARFLTEISKAQAAVVTGFSWGAAERMPFLPRLRYGRTVLSLARWCLLRSELPGRDVPWEEWREALSQWAARRSLPNSVSLTEGDRLLRLDLGQSAHLALLRAHLTSAEHAVLTEAPTGADAWFDGHAHEITVPMTATATPEWPAVPTVSATRLVGRDHGHLPGASRWLLAKLYGHAERQAEILGQHLPDLFAQWEEMPEWWYMRYRDPQSHLRLRIALPDTTAFGPAASRVSTWASRLRRAGLLSDVQFATSYPETGRWGTGAAMEAAEAVFGADSRSLAAQFTQPTRPQSQALAAANFVAITTAFTGSPRDGMDWLVRYGRIDAPQPLDRAVLDAAVCLADPTDDWAALQAAPGGAAIYDTWKPRHHALNHYRDCLHTAEGADLDTVLDSLLHAHHIRAVGIDKDDERTCVRLARAAALAWKARRG